MDRSPIEGAKVSTVEIPREPAATRPLVRSDPARTVHRWLWAQLALFCALGIAVVQTVFVQTSAGQRRDESLRSFVVDQAGRVWGDRAKEFAQGSFAAAFAVCVLVALCALARRRLDLLGLAATLVLGANATTQLLKHLLIERPPFADTLTNSLPSGHVTLVTSVSLALALVLARGWRAAWVPLGLLWTAAICVTTVACGWHRPSDVVAALLVCGAWGAVVQAVRPTASLR